MNKKTIYLIGGTMGVGKTTTCMALNEKLPNSVFLDGDWCWYANPFQVNEETKKMVVENITFLLNQYIHCNSYDNVILGWVMCDQRVIDELISKLDIKNCNIVTISLICNEETLKERLLNDIKNGHRTLDIIDRSIEKLKLYKDLNTIKIDNSNINIEEVVNKIINL